MRALIILFLIASPFIALAQSYHLHPALNHAPALARAVVAGTDMRLASMVRAVHSLIG